jgi:nicotinamidase/pyrazinamidase
MCEEKHCKNNNLLEGEVRTMQAILIVDPQNDFFPGGALGILNADKIIEPINSLLAAYQHTPLFISQDWHPKESIHFNTHGGIWPVHCVHGSKGAEIHKDIYHYNKAIIVKKGMNPQDDAGYSAFEGIDEKGRLLTELLKTKGIDNLIICGLATDYCVKASVLSALEEGFKVKLFGDGIRAVDLKPGDGLSAFGDMLEAGATSFTMEDICFE